MTSLVVWLSWNYGCHLIWVPICNQRVAKHHGLGRHIHGKGRRGMHWLHLIQMVVVVDYWDFPVGASHVDVGTFQAWIRDHRLLDHLLGCCFLASHQAANKGDKEPESKCQRKPYWESKLSYHARVRVGTRSATAGGCRRFFRCWWRWSIGFYNDLLYRILQFSSGINEWWLNFFLDASRSRASRLTALGVLWAFN